MFLAVHMNGGQQYVLFVCCLLFVVCCLLFVVVVRCLLFVVCCLLFQGTIGCTPNNVPMVFIVFCRDSWGL